MTDPQKFIQNFKNHSGRLPSQIELSKALSLPAERAIRELIRFSRTNAQEEPTIEAPEKRVPFDGISVGLYVVAAITFILSVYFTGLWFRTMFDLWLAGAISISMVSYMVLSPQAAGRAKGVVKVPLWVTFGIALVFSMGSTVAGQYNQLTESVDLQGAVERATLDLLRTEEADLVESIREQREQQTFHQQTLERLTLTAEDRIANQAYAATERNRVRDLSLSISSLQERLAEVRVSILRELEAGNIGVTEERSNFYSWLAALFGLTREQTEFLISALPAIFIDIIAALSLNLALSGRSRG